MLPIKLLGEQVTNTLSVNSNLERARAFVAVHSGAAVLTIKSEDGNTYTGSIQIPANRPLIIRKNPEELVQYAGTVTPVSAG